MMLAGVIGSNLIAVYLGFFRKFTVVERQEGPHTFIFRRVPLKGMGASLTNAAEIRALLHYYGIKEFRQFRVFVPELSANSHNKLGWVVPNRCRKQVAKIQGDIHIELLPVQRCMVIDFPRQGVLPFYIGVMRARRVFAKYRAIHDYNDAEIYAGHFESKTVYAQPIRK